MVVYASFVTYNPDRNRFAAALDSVSPQVDKVITVDNTEHNEGIARALNKAFEQAYREGCDYLITFDQDSVAPAGLVRRLLDDVSEIDKVGQIGPAYTGMKITSGGVADADTLITSGALTSVKAWHEAGGFRDDLFIDFVDIEFSLHLRKLGYKVLMDNGVVLDHQLGEGLKGWNILGKKRLGYVDHIPVRWYYGTRNCLAVHKEYSKDFPEYTSSLLRHNFRMVLRLVLNGKDIFPRLKMVLQGIRDFRNGTMGEYKHEG